MIAAFAAFAARRLAAAHDAVPVALADVDGQHLDAVPLGVLDDGRGRVEAHRLRVEKRTGEHVWVAALEPGRRVGDEREACRMALGKSVLTEAADLLEHPFRELERDALLGHARNQALVVTLDAAG